MPSDTFTSTSTLTGPGTGTGGGNKSNFTLHLLNDTTLDARYAKADVTLSALYGAVQK